MKKRLFLFLASVIVLSIALVSIGCGGKDNSSGIKPLEYWTFFSGGDGEYMTKLVSDYNKANPDNPVNAVIVDWGTYYTKLSTAYLGGTLPDIGTAHAHMLSTILTYGDLSVIDDVDPNFNWAQFPKATIDNITVDGKHLAIPFDTHGWVMYYNPELLKGTSLVDSNGDWKAKTWDELLAGLSEVKAKNPNIMPITINNPDTAFQWTWYSLYKQAGGEKFLNKDGLVELDTQAAKKALDALKTIYDKGYATKGHNSSLDFMKERKAAITFEGVWIAGALRESTPEIKARTIPAFLGKELAWGTGHIFILPKGNKVDPEKQARAVKFAQWLVDNGAIWANAGHIPAKIAVQESKEYKDNPNSVFQGLSTKVAPWPQSEYLDIAIGGQISIVANYIDQYLNGTITDINDMVKKINTEIEAKK